MFTFLRPFDKLRVLSPSTSFRINKVEPLGEPYKDGCLFPRSVQTDARLGGILRTRSFPQDPMVCTVKVHTIGQVKLKLDTPATLFLI